VDFLGIYKDLGKSYKLSVYSLFMDDISYYLGFNKPFFFGNNTQGKDKEPFVDFIAEKYRSLLLF